MASDPDHLRSETTFEDESFEDLDLHGASLAHKEFTRCHFRGLRLSDTSWQGTLLEDCVFVGCDLSNVRFRGASLRSVTFKDCKMVGVFWDSLGSDPMVGFSDCAMRYQSFASLSLRSTPFTRCSLVEASFAEVDLTRATFTDCDLARTTFDRCVLTSADLSSSTGVVFDAAKNRAKGAKISAETASAMAAALGLVVAGYSPARR